MTELSVQLKNLIAQDISSYGGRQFGLILDVDQTNISSASFENIGSGTSKGLKRYADLLFDRSNKYVKEKF